MNPKTIKKNFDYEMKKARKNAKPEKDEQQNSNLEEFTDEK